MQKYFIMYATLITELQDGILTITINRPDKLNALNKTVFDELDHVVDRVYHDNDVKAVMLTGQGEKAFAAGADISEFMDVSDEQGQALAERGQAVFFKIEDCPKPFVAAVNGFALGGGCELAMACHFRYASENAKFGQPEVNLGLIPGYGGTQRLTGLIGKGKAMELMMTGDMLGAEQALELGLVNKVLPKAELLAEVRSILGVIIKKSPVAIGRLVKAVNAFNHTRSGFTEEVKLFGEVFKSEDMKEGTKAFLEKRNPLFPGR